MGFTEQNNKTGIVYRNIAVGVLSFCLAVFKR